MLAASLPKVVMSEPKITGQGDEYTVELSIENQGVIPTALRQAQLVKIVRPDSVSMVFPAGMISTQAMGGRGGRGGRSDFADMGGGGGRGGHGGEGAQPEQPATNQDKVIMVEVTFVIRSPLGNENPRIMAALTTANIVVTAQMPSASTKTASAQKPLSLVRWR